MLPQRESLPAVTAAGVVAILFASVGILFGVLMQIFLIAQPNLESGSRRAALPPETRAAAAVVWLFILIVAIGELVVAINVLRRRNWARITILIWAGLMAFFCAISCVAVFFVMSVMPQSMPDIKDRGPFLVFMKFFLFVFYAIPFAVGVWWLILFTRPRVVSAFKTPFAFDMPSMAMDASGFPAPQTAALPAKPQKPSCPLPLLIVAGLLLSSAVSTPLILLLPNLPTMPFFFFGLTFSPWTGKVILSVLALLYGVAAIGLIRLKPFALHFVLFFQAVFFLNGIATIASPNFLNSFHEVMQQMAAKSPALPAGFPMFSDSFLRVMLIFGLVFSLTILGVLIGYRSRFLKAAAEAAR